MNKCTKCGTEFEGNFCPECGQRAEGQACPKCGALRENGAKFCKECGYSFSGASAAQTPPQKTVRQPRQISKKTESAFKNAHNILNILPAWISAVFTILVFVAMALPAVVTPSYEIMGEKIPSENLGSLFGAYAGNIEDVPLKGCAVAALLFAVLSVVLTGVLIAFCRVKQLNNSAVTAIKIYRVRVKTIVEMLCGAIYIAYIAISAAAMGIISATDEGTGLITSGVGVILLLVLACVAFIFTIVCAASDRFIILKNFPQFDELPERKPITLPVGIVEPSKPKAVAPPPQIPLSKRDYGPIRRFYARRKALAVLNVFLILITTTLIGFCIFPISWSIDHKLFNLRIILGYGGIEAIAVGVFIYLLAYLISSFRNSEKIINISICHNKRTTICLAVSVLFTLLSIIAVYSCISHTDDAMYEWLIRLNSIVLGLSFLLILIGVISLIKTKKYYLLVYGTKNPGKKPQLNEYGQKFITEQQDYVLRNNQYNHYLANMSAYKAKLKEYKLDKAMCQDGYNYRDEWDRRIYRVHTHKVLTAVVVLLLSVLIILAVVLPPSVCCAV